ncbi:MAG: aminotransferase class IV [Candidatus Omnitrophica bacterium]|nr:aminotransferase class IV [Candidatus Omnitrophota bacterium]MDE2223363.1 aminotransferase class IV [Candidatus Omnitrophota bacterium]
MKIIYLDGKYHNVNDQVLEAMTPGFFKARGVFETMLGLDGVVLDAEAHLKRLKAGLKTLKLRAPAVDVHVLNQVLRRNRVSPARVRLMVWQAGCHVHVMAAALPYKISDKVYRVCLVKTDRPASARMANVKSLDYALFADAYAKARAQGFDEALLLNAKGHIFEASRANIFWLKQGVLYTPPLSSGCLNGITRQQVIRQARLLKVSVHEKHLTPAMLKAADAAFLTNSLIGLQSISIGRH